MAKITLRPGLSNVNGWLGNVLSGGPGTSVVTHSASTFSFVLGAQNPLQGLSVTLKGKGFDYDQGRIVDGTSNTLAIADASGAVVLKIAGLARGGLPADAATFYKDVFGWSTPDNTAGPDPTAAWSHLMAGNDRIVGSGAATTRTCRV